MIQYLMKEITTNSIGHHSILFNSQQTNSAVDGVLATIMNAVAKNASLPEGAGGLMAALDRDHDGSILNDLEDFCLAQYNLRTPKTANGAGIV